MNRLPMLMLSVLIALCLPVVLVTMFWFAARGNTSRFSAIALALDCAGNAVMNGDYRETISSRAGRKWPRFARFVNWLFQDPNHCEVAVTFTQTEFRRPLK